MNAEASLSHRLDRRALGPCARVVCGAAIAIALCAADKPAPCPEISKTAQGVRLKVPPAVMRDLLSVAPGFKPLTMADFSDDVRKSYRFSKTQVPWAVIGDFDADGFCDLIVDGRTRTDAYRLCAWGSAEGPGVMTLGRRRLKASTGPRTAALTLVSKPELEEHVEELPGERIGDAFGERVSKRLERIYYWRKGRFKRVGRE